ncbi:GL24625 [Drosophila persimilis]|uniref:GL24625 n=1 Tax=Drosophila persimilis TaxID=7234 RepID=B4H5T0_DROPE|nr:GL24625 [Drosophila persimilis]
MSSIPNRATIRQASVAARQRQSRSHRLTRHTCFTMKRAAIFQVRKSLVEYVDVELADMETSVFYQRIFILAKNGCLEPEVEALTEVEEPPTSAAEAEKKEPELMAAEEEAPVPLDETTQGSTTEMSLAKAEGTEEATADAPGEGPATPQSAQDPTQRVNAEPDAQAEKKLLIICRLIAESLAPSEPSPDPDKEQDHHQTVSRVPSRQRFQELEEEREPEKVLSTAASRTGSKAPSVAPSTTPSAVPSTVPIMVPSRAPSVAPSIAASTAASVAGSLKAKSLEQVEFLSVDVYRKFLPEIQRIELVLASTRFYFTLAEFLDLYGTAPQTPDEDGLFWPIQNNYTPPNIFRRTPFDINLTFADYVAAKMKTDDDHHRESHLDFDDLEQIPETQQRPPEGDREAGPPAQ